jgi:2-oxoglutarate dehydrogenase E1 component
MSTTSFHRRTHVPRCRLDAEGDTLAAPVPAPALAKPDVQRFIDAHRQQGHRSAALDPAGPAPAPQLSPARFGLKPDDGLTADGSAVLGATRVRELDQRLKALYCGPLALDTSAVRDESRRAWLHARMESEASQGPPGGGGLLDRLIQAEAWEHHVMQRFPHGKRFSLEGCEALLPLLDALMERAAAQGVEELFLGMPHRGRVNVLVNVLGMAPADVLDHIDPQPRRPELHRDLVYHLGGRSAVMTCHGPLSVTLACNPSHLQSVYPVVMGMAHASRSAADGERTLAVVMHGDAAFAGQGVVMETLALTQKAGYSVGGAVHVVINNQVGFTEPNEMDPWAPRYCTDVTRMVDAPVLRANADAPEHVVRAAQIAVDYRMTFGADVVIDLVGYRRLGHSEHDVPELTSPRRYAELASRPSVVELYGAVLAARQATSDAGMASYIARARAGAAAGVAFARDVPGVPLRTLARPARPRPIAAPSRAWLQAAVAAMTRMPEGFRPHPLVRELVARWNRTVTEDDAAADWCFAENMAYASVLGAGIPVRISGMDVQRGTFLHRHAVWHDQASQGEDGEFVPLAQLGAGAARFDAVNSLLSEEAVLGFEYGYSVQDPRTLTIWEAQFGDFVNGAQVFIDQYISGGEEKWGYRSALTLLLPHGYEGIGPEHSSAYLNRFLDLCAGDNLRVACPSTSAQMFHLLRRQAGREERKPLVVLTPKGTLYQESASHSPVHRLTDGAFEPVLDDDEVDAQAVTRVVVCSGKLHYDLRRARQAGGCRHVALLRLEQFHPFPHAALARVLARYGGMRTLTWAQEENRNQGAWGFVRDELAALCPPGVALQAVARLSTASGATSSVVIHQRQQRELVARALGLAVPVD